MPDIRPQNRHDVPRTKDKRWQISAIAFLVFWAMPVLAVADEVVVEVAHGVPDQASLDLIAQLDQLLALLATPGAAVQSNAALIEAAGLAARVRSADFATASAADPRPATARPVR